MLDGVYTTEQDDPAEIVQVVPGDENEPDPLAENDIVSPVSEPV